MFQTNSGEMKKGGRIVKPRKNQPLIIPGVSEEEIKRRHRMAREIMKREGIAAIIVAGSQVSYGSGSHHIRYLTNYGVYYAEGYLVFPYAGEPVLFCRSKNSEYTASQVAAVSTRMSSFPTFARDMSLYLQELKVEGEKIGIVGLEVMPAYVYLDLCQVLPKAKFVFISKLFLEQRLIKTEEEKDLTRKAGEIADQAYTAIKTTARTGVWEYEVSAAVEQAFAAKGALSPAFILISSGESPSFPAFPGSQRRLNQGDTILNELTPSYGGYWVQWGRPFVVGKPSRQMEDLFKITLEAYHFVEKELRPGRTFGQLRETSRLFIENRGYTWLSGAIQFIGLDITEQACFVTGEKYSVKPVFRPIDERELSPGMIVVNQPNVVTTDLSKGMLLIDTCIVTEGDPEVLSHSPLEYTRVE
jgi:Xaa-Pro dipeptidase